VTTRRARDAGMTLVELSVAMFVSSVLLAGIAAVFTGTLRAVETTNVRTADSADLRIGLEAVARPLRVAVQPAGEDSAVVTAQDRALSFYALLNRTGTDSTSQPLPTLVQFTWNPADGCLNRSLTPARSLAAVSATGSIYAWDTGTVTSCLLRTSAPPAFRYFDGATTTAALSTPVADATLPVVISVEVTITGRVPANTRVAGVPATVRVTLENVIAAQGGS
jgi:prepilin-type N-terminal cleavage/methylation domain-containing protein